MRRRVRLIAGLAIVLVSSATLIDNLIHLFRYIFYVPYSCVGPPFVNLEVGGSWVINWPYWVSLIITASIAFGLGASWVFKGLMSR